MTKDQAIQLFTLISVNYPNYFNNWNEAQVDTAINTWFKAFKDYDAEVVTQGLEDYIFNKDTAFPPTPGQVKAGIVKLAKLNSDELSEFEAWEIVKNTMSSKQFRRETQKTFDNLPKDIRAAVGSAQTMREWSLTERGLNYLHEMFERNYNQVIERKWNKISHNPKMLSDVVKNTQVTMLPGENDGYDYDFGGGFRVL